MIRKPGTRTCWMTLATTLALAATALGAGETEEKTIWYALSTGGRKAGHARYTRRVEDGRVLTTMKMSFCLARGRRPLTIRTTNTHIETLEGEPLAYRYETDLGGTAKTVRGTVEDGQITVVTKIGQTERTRTTPWPEGALMSEGLRLLQLRQGAKPGTSYKAKSFEAGSSSAMDMQVRIGKREKTDLFGRVVLLREVRTTMASPLGKITSTSYVDEQFYQLKSSIPAFGTRITLTACPKAAALAEGEPSELLQRVMASCPKPDGDPRDAATVTFRLKPVGDHELAIPETDDQTVRREEDGTVVVTVHPVAAPSDVALPYVGDDERARAALRPSQYVESDDETVVALAREAVGDADDAATAARRIEAFVREHIADKNLSVGYASAAEVADAKTGDCTEHAVLTAAMCRAAGIPAEMVSGLAYAPRYAGREHVLVPHAWCRAYVGATWVGLDAAIPEGYGAARIALSAGSDADPQSFINVATTLGYFEVADMTLGE